MQVLSGITIPELDILDKFEDVEYERKTVDVSLTVLIPLKFSGFLQDCIFVLVIVVANLRMLKCPLSSYTFIHVYLFV